MVVVDQNPLTRWVFVARLSERGHTVREADTAAGARDVLRAGAHLMLLDPFLPDCSPREFLLEIRHDFPESRVIVMSSFRSLEARKGVEADGWDTILDKPVDVEDVVDMLDDRLRRWD